MNGNNDFEECFGKADQASRFIVALFFVFAVINPVKHAYSTILNSTSSKGSKPSPSLWKSTRME